MHLGVEERKQGSYAGSSCMLGGRLVAGRSSRASARVSLLHVPLILQQTSPSVCSWWWPQHKNTGMSVPGLFQASICITHFYISLAKERPWPVQIHRMEEHVSLLSQGTPKLRGEGCRYLEDEELRLLTKSICYK